jgi:hypothetical protein
VSNRIYSARFVARAKALLARGMTIKSVARRFGVPCPTVADWKLGRRCGDVLPDPEVLAYIDGLAATEATPAAARR